MEDNEKDNRSSNRALLTQNGQRSRKINNDISETSLKDLQLKVDQMKKYVFGLFILLMVACVVLIITVAVLFANLKWELKHHDHPPKVGAQMNKILEKEELCLACDEVRLGPSIQEDRRLDYFKRKPATDTKKEQCCVETPAQLLELLQMFVERKYREEIAQGKIKIKTSTATNTDVETPAAHLIGFPQRKTDIEHSPGRLIEIGDWLDNTDLAFTNNVNYRNGRIVIQEAGLYYVYSQMSFLERFDTPTAMSSGAQSLSHYIYRYNIIYRNGGEEQMVQSSFTKCSADSTRKVGEYTSYLGSVFYLRVGDEMFVKVSDLALVVWEPKQNYFGLFKVN